MTLTEANDASASRQSTITRAQRRGLLSSLVPRAYLSLALEGRPTAGSARYEIGTAGAVILGRGTLRRATHSVGRSGRDLRIDFPDRHASSTHARLTRPSGEWIAEDLGSKNGLFVNGRRTQHAELADGDRVRIGETLFLFRAALPTPDGAPRDLDAPDLTSALGTLVPSLALEYDALASVAPSTLPVLVLGETGTGKEVTSRAVYGRPVRGDQLRRAPGGARRGGAVRRSTRRVHGRHDRRAGALPDG